MNCIRLTLFVTLLLAGITAAAQTTPRVVKGVVRDSSGQAIPGASVRLATAHDTTGTITGEDGSFRIPHIKETRFSILVYMMSYAGFKRDYSIAPGDTAASIGTILLASNVQQLKTITVKANPIAVVFRGDTVEYSTSAYPVRDGSNVGEVVRRLPGLDMDHNGKVTTQGKEISRIRVNGKDFFGSDVSKALKNLPADIVEKLQVIDDYGDQANLSGVKTGEPQKIINLTLKPDKSSGVFGTVTAGAGTDNRHLASFNLNRFRGERQFSVYGDLNNTNAGAFSFGDNGGISGGDGNTMTHSFGINYRDKLSKTLVGYGSFAHSDSKSSVTGITAQQTVDGSHVSLNNQQNTNINNSNNENFNYNLEYKPDTLNFLKFTPNLSWGKGSSAANSQFHIEQNNLNPVKISDGSTTNTGTNNNFNFSANLMYNHRFHKQGRNLNATLAVSTGTTTNLQDTRTLTHLDYVDSLETDTTLHQQVNSPGNNSNYNARLSYTEPLSKTSVLELNYNLNSNTSSSQRETWNIDPGNIKTRVDSQSNYYRYQFVTQRLSLNYNLRGKRHNLVLGISAQPQTLSGTSTQPDFSTRKTTVSMIPALRYAYNINNNQSFSISYNGNSNQPGFKQLMPVTDLTNPQYPVVGNPDLKPEFTHAVNLNYRIFNPKAGNSFFVGLGGTTTSNKVLSNIINDSAHLAQMSSTVIQETRYLNADGSFSGNGYYNYSQPLLHRKLTLTMGGALSYSNNISYVNDVRQLGRNLSWSQNLRLRLTLLNLMEVEGAASYTSNITRYSTPGGFNTTTNGLSFELYGKNYIGKHVIIGYNGTKTINSGYSSGVGANPAVVNLYLECQFLKGNKAAIRLQGFDLLNENTGVYHNVSGPVITDTRNERLARYFMLSFSYRIQKFGF